MTIVSFVHIFFSSAVTIGFNDTTYNVTEGGSVNVSVSVQSGTLARDVVVTLQTMNGTATGRVVSHLIIKFRTVSVPFGRFCPSNCNKTASTQVMASAAQ